MDFKGQLNGISKDLSTNEFKIEIRTNNNILEAFQKMKDMVLDITIKKHTEKRSLNANAYYWQLIRKLSKIKELNMSEPHLHNHMLRRHPVPVELEGSKLFVVVPDTPEAEKKVDESETYHLKPTAQVKTGKDGKLYRTYIVLKGSHEYDTKEMSMLIDDAVQEAKEQGIETLPPAEIERLKNEWGIQLEQKNKSTSI